MKKSFLYLSLMIVINLGMNEVSYSQWIKSEKEFNCASALIAINDNTIYANIQNSLIDNPLGPISGYSFLLSTDKGESWKQIATKYFDEGINALFFDGVNLYAGRSGYGLYFSNDNGQSWNPLNIGMKEFGRNRNVYSIMSSGNNIYVGTSEGLFVSSDKGKSWKSLTSDGASKKVVLATTIVGTNIFIGTTKGVFVSADNGASWVDWSNGLTEKYICELAVIGTKVFAAAADGKIYLTTDNGTNWKSVSNGLKSSTCNKLIAFGTNLFAGNLGGVFISTDSGESWKPVNGGMHIVLNEVYDFAIMGDYLFASAGGEIWKRPISEMITAYTQTPESFIIKGNQKFAANNFIGAIADYYRAIELNPKSDTAYHNCAYTIAASGDYYEDAIIYYSQAIELNPRYIEAIYNRGSTYLKSGKNEKAIEDFNKTIELNPKAAIAYNDRGYAKFLLGNKHESINDFSKAIELVPNYLDAYYNRGYVRLDLLRDLPEAIKDFDKAIQLNPKHSLAFQNRGIAKFRTGDKVGGCKDWEQAVALGLTQAADFIKQYCK